MNKIIIANCIICEKPFRKKAEENERNTVPASKAKNHTDKPRKIKSYTCTPACSKVYNRIAAKIRSRRLIILEGKNESKSI